MVDAEVVDGVVWFGGGGLVVVVVVWWWCVLGFNGER